jgi:hypothetical protein
MDLRFTGVGFSSPDATKVAEGAVINVSSLFNFRPARKKLALDLDVHATGFELLLGRFYGDFTDRRVQFSARTEYAGSEDLLVIPQADLNLPDMGTLLISGQVSRLTQDPLFASEAQLVAFSNKQAYDFFIRDTFKESFPFLGELEIDGYTSAVLSAKGTKSRFGVKGMVQVKDMKMVSRDLGLDITGIDVALPVDASYPQAALPSKSEDFGSLQISRLSWHDVEITDLVIFPSLWQNSLVIRDDIALPFFGGTLVLQDIIYKDILYPQRNLRLSASADSLDLAQMSSALGIPEFRGTLSGTIPMATLSGNHLFTEGEIDLTLFGGEMKIGEISVSNLFSPAASIKSSLEFKKIDLSQLTDTFEFGHISGILQGYVRDLEIVKGQPESFEALFETVKRKGTPQKISVEALEKITILGSGTTPSLFGKGVYRLFKQYRYSKMGFRSRLKNDNFNLLGIDVIGGREYLVRGSILPPKVNVINYTRNISFREMVKRLKRIQTTGEAETGK